MFDILANAGKEVLGFGVSFAGSLVTGYIKKRFTPQANDTIPVTNTIGFGAGGELVSGGDPSVTVACMAGSLAASVVHKTVQYTVRKIRKM